MTPDQIKQFGLLAAGILRPAGYLPVPKKVDAAKLARLMTQEKPEPEAFAAVVEVLAAMDRRLHGQLLVAMYGVKTHHWLFQLALAVVWVAGGGARAVTEAAKTREVLKSWFAYARFDWPCDGIVADALTVWTPREMTVYRGGRGDPAKLADEYSWTPHRCIAAKFAVSNPHPHHDADGQPVIVRRTVTREEIALKAIHGAEETILLDPGPFEVDCVDVDELSDLAAEARIFDEKIRQQRDAFVARHRHQGSLAL